MTETPAAASPAPTGPEAGAAPAAPAPGRPVSAGLSAEEIAASLRTGRDLGPAYDDAVAASLVDRIGAEIDARVDARMARQNVPAADPAADNDLQWKSPRLMMGFMTMIFAIPLGAIGGSYLGPAGVIAAWAGLIAIFLIAVVGQGRR
ncbi:hypothetical protein [Nocardiopsis coralliicola]